MLHYYWYQGQIWTNVRILSGAVKTGTGTFSCLYLTIRLKGQTTKSTAIATFLKPRKMLEHCSLLLLP